MHMADALLSPVVGGTMWAATAATAGYCAKKGREEGNDREIPLMGVLGAFVFAAQMINFSIPGTGSSGHLGGGLLLAILLGPHPAFLTMTSILTVQALFFADGGLLALGSNIFNLGFFPCFVAYPLIYKPLIGREPSSARITLGSLVAAILGLQMGAFGVVVETVFSGVSELPFAAFALLMQPIHAGIGIIEGLVTAAVVSFVRQTAPGVLAQAACQGTAHGSSYKKIMLSFGVTALITGAGLAWFASANPDGLEWSVARVAGSKALEDPGSGLHSTLNRLQERFSFLPGYSFRSAKLETIESEAKDARWPAVDSDTSVAGIVGGFLTLLIAGIIGWLLRRKAPTV